MTSLFNFTQVKAELIRKTSSLNIDLNTHSKMNLQDLNQVLLELKQSLNFASKYIEISSIYITGLEYFSLRNISNKNLTPTLLLNFLKELQDITYSFLYLPQTIIVDFEKSASDIGLELGLSADIKISHTKAEFSFDYLSMGLTPGCAMLGIHMSQIQKSLLKSWLLLGTKIDAQTLYNHSLLTLISDCPKKHLDILETVHSQSSTARIQLKRSSLTHILPQIETIKEAEMSYSRSSLLSGDFLNFIDSKENNKKPSFKTAKEFSSMVKNETMA